MIKCACSKQSCSIEAGVTGGRLWASWRDDEGVVNSVDIFLTAGSALVLIGELVNYIGAELGEDDAVVLGRVAGYINGS
jgi:hypothetical protein